MKSISSSLRCHKADDDTIHWLKTTVTKALAKYTIYKSPIHKLRCRQYSGCILAYGKETASWLEETQRKTTTDMGPSR